MITTSVGAEQLFEDPEFGTLLTEWQRSRIVYDEQTAAFTRTVQDEFPDSDAPISTADYICELPIDELVGTEYYTDPFILSDRAHDIADVRLKTADENTAYKDMLIEYGQSVDTNQFALWGLRRHLHLEAPGISKAALIERIKTTEDRLLLVDRFIREHGGEVIIVLGRYSEVTAARVRGDGLAIVGNHRATTPLVAGHRAYTSAKIFGDLHHYDDTVLSLDPITITMSEPAVVEPADLLKPERFHGGGLAFTSCDMVEGPPHITHGRDVEYFTDVLNQARYVTKLAALPVV